MSSAESVIPVRTASAELNSLTDEILIKIFVHLDFKTRHCWLPLVCLRWANLVRSNELWHDVRVAPHEESALSGGAVSQIKVFRWCSQPHVRPFLRSLTLKGLGTDHDDFTPVGIGALLGISCQALTRLKLQATRALLSDLSYLLCLFRLRDLVLVCTDPDPLRPFRGSDIQCVAHLQELRTAVFDLNLVLVPGDLSRLKKLRMLSVSGTGTSSLIFPFCLSVLPVEELVVKNPLWAEVPDVVMQFPCLRSLEIRRHPFAHNLGFSSPSGKMQRLQRLGIVAHQLQRTPEEVGEMIFLRHLDLSGNKFDERLPMSVVFPFKKLCRLESLDISGCGLRELPSPLRFLANLTELNLSGNVLETVSNVLSHCLSLKRLVMVGCGLGTVPAQISEIPNLEHLDISNNPVTCVEGLSDLLKKTHFVALVFRQDRWTSELVASACRIARMWGRREPIVNDIV